MTISHTLTPPTAFLRRALLADAVLSGGTGLMMIAGAHALGDLLALPAILLRAAGMLLMPYVAFVLFVALRDYIARPAVLTIVVINLLWAVASIGLLFTGLVAPNLLGYAFVIGQAVIVAALGELQYVALRR